jgi:hypothetical protein
MLLSIFLHFLLAFYSRIPSRFFATDQTCLSCQLSNGQVDTASRAKMIQLYDAWRPRETVFFKTAAFIPAIGSNSSGSVLGIRGRCCCAACVGMEREWLSIMCYRFCFSKGTLTRDNSVSNSLAL